MFAGLTAIFAKVGIQVVDSDLATLIRTAIIVVLSAFVAYTGTSVSGGGGAAGHFRVEINTQ